MTRLRVMTYNMLHAPGDRLASLVSVVKSVGPDLLACQEVNTFDGMMALSRELGMLPVWGIANSPEDYRDGQPVFEHLVVFTRIAPRAVRVHRGDARAMFRPVLEVRLQPPGGPEITTFTVHLRALIDPHERFLKFRELGALLAILSDADGPVIAMGDFNALAPDEVQHSGDGPWRTEPPEDHLVAVRGSVIGALLGSGLVDSYRSVHPFDGKNESTLVGRGGRRLDYIFVSPSLRASVSDSFILDNEMVQVASDHRPVVTDLIFEAVDEQPASDGAGVSRSSETRQGPASDEKITQRS
jgi:endonuclease/exonuclease/phosphatase family metal-dependent hydrolase